MGVPEFLELITPHGDRKQRIPDHVPDGQAVRSLPLMGIVNRTWRTYVTLSMSFSLPLMGIVNRADQREPRPPTLRSLPSWGS